MRNVVTELTDRFREKNTELSQLKDHAEQAKANAWLHTLEYLGAHVLDALQPILTNVQMTASETPSIRESVQRMRGLSEDIRRLGSTERETERRSIAPRKLVSDSVRLLVDDEMGQQNPIHVDISPELESLNILPEPTRQALLNMLRNAIRASPPASPIQVKLRSEAHSMLVIEVIDQGSGMTDEQIQEATTPFYSGFDPRGNGLGLTLVRLVAELHSGRIALLGNDPEGTICQLWIPKGAA
jgi:two-component system sensor histidine kinase KdpD